MRRLAGDLARGMSFFAVLVFVACDELSPLGTAHPIIELAATSIDFGKVPEGESAERALELRNIGQVRLSVTLALDASSSRDFSIATASVSIESTSSAEIIVHFDPEGAGADQGLLQVKSDDPEKPSLDVQLTGGPIFPKTAFAPDPVDFGPAENMQIAKAVSIENHGDANLHISEISVDLDANDDFSLRSFIIPEILAPGGEIELTIDYLRSERGTPGRLVVRSDDPQAPEASVRLLPDPLRACEDHLDNDGDGQTDFPDDPGCTSATDDDEENPPECEEGAHAACGTDVGACEKGERVCVDHVWGACVGGRGPEVEACDGVDNDCDERVDEGISEACVINGCAGVRACVEGSSAPGGEWSACIAVAPEVEVCDGVDNDCNGTIDEGIVESCRVFDCSGQRVCVPGGSGEFTACQVMSAPEVCDGVDNDCNGIPDDNLADLVCGVGACARSVAACSAGVPNTCTPGNPTPEVCNGLDDNCDGIADNNIPNLSCGTGACFRSVAACNAGVPNTCTPGNPTTEVCNGLDDNCDGSADNNIPNLSCGTGACFRSVAACNAGVPNTCTPGNPTTEVCNGLDDNCDGSADNNIPNLSCGTGACLRSVAACNAGVPNTCTPGAPSTETCNMIDDDCNGVVDNGTCTAACGLMSTAADPQEPNNASTAANPVVPPGAINVHTYDYDLTLPPGDTDWLQFNFPPAGSGTWADMTASITCASWAGAGCSTSSPAIGLEAWYVDDCGAQQDGSNNGVSGLATVSSNGPIAFFGLCGPQRFRLRALASTTVCSGEALNAHLHVVITWTP